jgi:hypothetical protein
MSQEQELAATVKEQEHSFKRAIDAHDLISKARMIELVNRYFDNLLSYNIVQMEYKQQEPPCS